MQLRREKGLCYFCDEKFSFNHKCANRQLLMLQGEEEDEPIDNLDPDPPDISSPTTAQPVEDHHLSLNALKGGTGVGIIRFSADINGLNVTVLVDGGSSDNFIQPRVAKFLKLPVEQVPSLKVMVGNGSHMSTEGFIRNLAIRVQGVELKLHAFILPISGADLILGTKWLATLGLHLADYQHLRLKFLQNGRFVTLQGEPLSAPIMAKYHHLRRMCSTGAISEIYTIELQHSNEDLQPLPLPEDMEPELALLLHTYREVFAKPSGLPPNRLHDHAIPLMAGSTPVKMKPYRYPHSQKQ